MAKPIFSLPHEISGQLSDIAVYEQHTRNEVWYIVELCTHGRMIGTYDFRQDCDTCRFRFSKGELPYDLRALEQELSDKIMSHNM